MDRNREIYKVTLWGGVMNVLLLLFKFVAGVVAGSAAMIADAVHSLSDFVTDVAVLALVRISSKPADRTHEFGHEKYETVALTFIGFLLFAVSLCIVYGGLVKIVLWMGGRQLETPGMLALWAALVSIFMKENTFRYSIRKAHELGSPAVEANAWHHRSDALSSVGTAIGIGGAILLGPRWAVLDPLASVIVGLFIARVAFVLLRGGIGDLTEQSLPEDVEQEILRIAESVEGIREPHNLRTRRIGSHYAIQLHLLMDGDLPLRQAHDKESRVEELLRKRYGDQTHIIVHAEPIEKSRMK